MISILRRWGALLALLSSGLYSHIAAASPAPYFEVSQDGRRFRTLHLITGSESAKNFYNYIAGSGHPDFGGVAGDITTCLYLDSTTNVVSLITLGGMPAGQRGSATAPQGFDSQIMGLPRTTKLGLTDTPHAVHYHDGGTLLVSDGTFDRKTDGYILNGLNLGRTLQITLRLSNCNGIQQWRVASGDPSSGGAFHEIYLSKTLYIREIPLRGVHGVNPGGPGVGEGTGPGMGDGAGDGSGDGSGGSGDGGLGGSGGSTGTDAAVPEPAFPGAMLLFAWLAMRRPRAARNARHLRSA